jgi:pimeloyl-ACP methyl ester carboxylesterase
MVSFTFTAPTRPAIGLGRVTLSNGVTLHYAHQGPREGLPMIMLHGFPDSWVSFSRVMPLLPFDLRVIVPDLRGHGASDRPLIGYRLTDLAGDIVGLMDALQIPQAIVVGHSMGSFVARKLVQIAPGRVSRLVLVGGGATADTPNLRGLLQAVDALTDPVDEAFVREFQQSTVCAPVPRDFMEAAIANSCRTPARVWRAALRGFIEEPIALVRPDMRTLVLGGKQDSVFSPMEQMALARLFPRGELHLLEGVGHALHWEQPETFVSALKRFGV